MKVIVKGTEVEIYPSPLRIKTKTIQPCNPDKAENHRSYVERDGRFVMKSPAELRKEK